MSQTQQSRSRVLNFTNTLKQDGVQESTIAELVGHRNSSITMSRYGKRYEPGPLLEALEKLGYGLKLDDLKDALTGLLE